MSDASSSPIDEFLWSPPIPSIGRGGQRATVSISADFECKLKDYYLQVKSVPDFFVRAVSGTFRRQFRLFGRDYAEKLYLSDLDWQLQYRYIRSRMYGRDYSIHFKRKLSSLLKAGKLQSIRQWFFTANGFVLPYIMGGGEDFTVIDSMTKSCLEGCANNYAQFIKSLKLTKKLIRKSAAVNGIPPSGIRVPRTGKTRQFVPYFSHLNKVLSSLSTRVDRMTTVLLWTQSRATGLCDSVMIDESLSKFMATTMLPSTPLSIDVGILQSCIRTGNVTGYEAQVSCGPKACLQSPQKPRLLEPEYYVGDPEPVGGQTAFLLQLCRHRVLRGTYDLKDLSVSLFEKAMPVRSARDLLDWAIQEALESPGHVRSVRFHCVADQSKARAITVAHYAYQVIMGVFAHALVPGVLSDETFSGLRLDKHLWRFLHTSMSPESPSWDGFTGQEVWAFSTDLSEATDYGNWWFGRAVWSEFIRQTRGPRQPTALMLLAKTLYTSPRTVYYRNGMNRYSSFQTRRGFLMGDMFTKVVLTIGQDYNVRSCVLNSPLGEWGSNKSIKRTCKLQPYNLHTLEVAGLLDRVPVRPKLMGAAYSLVGDDVVILYAKINRTLALEPYFKASAHEGGWKVSDEDTFDSKHLMFYCEEGSIPPQGPQSSTRHRMWRGRPVEYLDYPRIRLLLPVKMETDIYSHTNVGRFSLLGKEMRDVVDTSTEFHRTLFSVAQLLQRALLPRDIECLCPFLPQEIGGDGGYTDDPDFLVAVITSKSTEEGEVLYRMRMQMGQFWSHKFLSTEKNLVGTLKRHLILPTLERMRGFIPKNAIITPPSSEARECLDSLPRGLLESPQQTFFKLMKRAYYWKLFQGKVLPNLRVGADVSSKRGNTSVTTMWDYFDHGRIRDYLDQWRRPGFMYRDMEPYYVIPRRHKDIMSLNWNWKVAPEPATEVARIGLDEFLKVILRGQDLPLIVDRLNLFFESDPLLMIRVRENPAIKARILLVSRDKKLAQRILRFVWANRDRHARVLLVSPEVFFLGRVPEVESDFQLFDAGSINFFGRNAADSNMHDVHCNDLQYRPERAYPGVTSVYLRGFDFPVKPTRNSYVVRGLETETPVISFRRDEADAMAFLSERAEQTAPPPYSME